MRTESCCAHLVNNGPNREQEVNDRGERSQALMSVTHQCRLSNDGGSTGLDCELNHGEVKFKEAV